MNNWVDMLKEFHRASEIIDPDTPQLPPLEKIHLRRNLIEEESQEIWLELSRLPECQDIEQIAKELSDLIYVTIGTALAYGINIDRAFTEVHRSNMTKFPNGKALRRADGKILKPPTYEHPDMGVIWDDEVPQN